MHQVINRNVDHIRSDSVHSFGLFITLESVNLESIHVINDGQKEITL